MQLRALMVLALFLRLGEHTVSTPHQRESEIHFIDFRSRHPNEWDSPKPRKRESDHKDELIDGIEGGREAVVGRERKRVS